MGKVVSEKTIPPAFFERLDSTPDGEFYVQPRFVPHIDPETVAALTASYTELLPAGCRVLDLMSSWISHLPAEVSYAHVAGLGMNAAELAANPRLTTHVVHDLNADPELPFEAASFDAVVNAVSIQYLTRPIEVFREVGRVLAPGGISIIATSHRMFPTKAIRAWHTLAPEARLALIVRYFELAEAYEPAEILDRSPANADPLWLVMAKRSS